MYDSLLISLETNPFLKTKKFPVIIPSQEYRFTDSVRQIFTGDLSIWSRIREVRVNQPMLILSADCFKQGLGTLSSQPFPLGGIKQLVDHCSPGHLE